MLRPALLILLITLLLSLLIACSSGRSALRRGNYDLAVKRAAQRLTQRAGLGKRGYTMAPAVLKLAFDKAYTQHQQTIRRLSAPTTDTTFRWERVYQEYSTLQTLTNEARRGLAQRGLAQRTSAQGETDWLSAYPATYEDRQRETRALAAADRYEAAEHAFTFRRENRLAARDAYQHYQKALDWVPDFREATARADEALGFALLRVALEPLSPTPEISPDDNLHLQALIMKQLRSGEAPSTFVRLYPLRELGVEGIPLATGWPIHQTVQMVVADYRPYRDNTTSAATTVYSDQLYKVGTKKINDSTTVDVLEKVNGTLTTFHRSIDSYLELHMRALDAQTGAVLWEEPLSESQHWATEWQTFQGDSRALNGHTPTTASLLVPSRWSMYESMRDDLARSVVYRLRRKYAHD